MIFPANVIAEIGINHNGKLDQALSLIKEAYLSGCYGIKFQYRNLKRAYSNNNSDEIGDSLLKSEINRCYLTPEEIIDLSKLSRKKYKLKVGISFFIEEDLDDFKDLENNFDFFKIPSVEFTNNKLIKRLSGLNKLLLLSLGCQEESTILEQIKSFDLDRTVLMHCVSNYPLEIYNAKLGYIKHLKKIWPGKVGYSSHDYDWKMCLPVISMGVDFIERHITHNKNDTGLDHSTSSTPSEFKEICFYSKNLHLAMKGNHPRALNAGELINKQNLGRSPYVLKKINKGTIITNESFVWRSPQVGLNYENLEDFILKPTIRDINKDDAICAHHFEKNQLNLDSSDWIKKYKISLPVRLHDSKSIEKEVRKTSQELHLSFNETLSSELLNEENFSSQTEYSIHLPDYIDSNTIIDPFSTNKEIRSKSNLIINNCIKLSKILNGLTSKEVPIVGSFSTFYKNKLFSINQINTFCKENSDIGKYIMIPQLLPPIAWYFGGSVKLKLFNSLEDIEIIKELNCNYCLDISHAFMCNFNEKNFLNSLLSTFHLVRHLHIAGASGIDGEGEPISTMNKEQLNFLQNVLNLPYIKVIEVWQGHLNNFYGFNKALKDIEKIIIKK
tara:strand:+ start:13692 stop:15530 length:1839 start_codon:yes stop_codon:yes gene_type:complete